MNWISPVSHYVYCTTKQVPLKLYGNSYLQGEKIILNNYALIMTQ